MKYALVGSERTEARPQRRVPRLRKRNNCKMRQRRDLHWAHHPVRHCDPWWEGETEWHRTWTNHFAPVEQEGGVNGGERVSLTEGSSERE